MRKKSFAGQVSAFLKRFFRARNIIIVSAHKVDHIPLSGVLQVVVVVAVVLGFSVFSYMAGGYMHAQSLVEEKEKKLHVSEMEKSLMDKDFALLKRDLVKIRTNGKQLSEYSKFIIGQYGEDGKKPVEAAGDEDNKLFSRIQYLEKRIEEITSENSHLMLAIRERTQGRIDLFEDIIAATGLNMGNLERAASDKAYPATRISRSPVVKSGEETASDMSGQGGPFIPYDMQALSKDNQELLGDIERLVLLDKIVDALPIGLPVARYQERSGFGRRLDPFTRRPAMHLGLDLAGPAGSKVLAANDGKVSAAGREGAYGNMVEVEHGLGLATRYAHLGSILVREGDRVKKGQPIGIQGTTGRSTGPHVHYEVRYKNRPIDPKKFLTARNLYVSQQD